jgi:hypothetical protein
LNTRSLQIGFLSRTFFLWARTGFMIFLTEKLASEVMNNDEYERNGSEARDCQNSDRGEAGF